MTTSAKTVLFSLIIVFVEHSSPNSTFYFREHYVLLEDSFYSLNNDTFTTWVEAKDQCQYEGATLFYPENEAELKRVQKDIVSGKNSRCIHIGVHNLTGAADFKTADDTLFTQTVQRSDRGKCVILTHEGILRADSCEEKCSFVCKKTQASVKWNQDCKMAVLSGNDYEYNTVLKKCYKLHTTPKTWDEADKICAAEMSSLAELNSQEEADHLMAIVKGMPEDLGVVCLGFKVEDGKWKTLSGLNLQASGYTLWAHTQPDGGYECLRKRNNSCASNRWRERCGAMTYNGRLHDMPCDGKCLIVCEHDVKK